METFACVQDSNDPEGHTLLCFGIGCPKRDTYELVTIAGGGGVSGATVLSSGPITSRIELVVDEARTRSFKWEVARSPTDLKFLTDIARQKELRLKPVNGVERVLPLKNYAAELNRLKRFCGAK